MGAARRDQVNARNPSSLMSDLQTGKWKPVYPPLKRPSEPNFPINELFLHIDPNVLGRNNNVNTFDLIGDDLRDKLALGQLKIWGRPCISSLHGGRHTLREIDPKYWNFAHFTYIFFDDTAPKDEPHTYVDHGHNEIAYTDLQVNRAEAMAIWPPR